MAASSTRFKRSLSVPATLILMVALAACGNPDSSADDADSDDTQSLKDVTDDKTPMWSASVGDDVGTPQLASPHDDVIVVTGLAGVGAYAIGDGEALWEEPFAGDAAEARVYVSEDLVVVRDGERIAVRELDSGDVVWSHDQEVKLGYFAVTEEALATVDCGETDGECTVNARKLTGGEPLWDLKLTDISADGDWLVLPPAENQAPAPIQSIEAAHAVADTELLVFGDDGSEKKVTVTVETGDRTDIDDWHGDQGEMSLDGMVVSASPPKADNCLVSVQGVDPETGEREWKVNESRWEYEADDERTCDETWTADVSGGALLSRTTKGPHLIDPVNGDLLWQGGGDADKPVGYDGENVAVVLRDHGHGDLAAVDVRYNNDELWTIPMPDTVEGERVSASSQNYFVHSFGVDEGFTTVFGGYDDGRLMIGDGQNRAIGLDDSFVVTAGPGSGDGGGTTLRLFRP